MDRKNMTTTKIKPINVNPTTSLRDEPHLGELDNEGGDEVIFSWSASTNMVLVAGLAESLLLEMDPRPKGWRRYIAQSLGLRRWSGQPGGCLERLPGQLLQQFPGL